jgi:hypothetical protein
MIRRSVLLLLVAVTCLASPQARPVQGQSAAKQEQDNFECYEWAKRQTGFDPQAEAPGVAEPAAPPAQEAGSAAASRAIGGPIGMGVHAARRRRATVEGQQEQQQADERERQRLVEFNHARGVCLAGRGYEVK